MTQHIVIIPFSSCHQPTSIHESYCLVYKCFCHHSVRLIGAKPRQTAIEIHWLFWGKCIRISLRCFVTMFWCQQSALHLFMVSSLRAVTVCIRLVLGAADVDTDLQRYSCCLLYQCLLTDSQRYTQRLLQADDSSLPLMCTVLSFLVSHDCEWG